MSPTLSRRLASAFFKHQISIEEKDQILAAAKGVDDYDQLAPEIRTLIAKAEA